MRLKSTILCSTASLLAAISPVHAQTTSEQTAPDVTPPQQRPVPDPGITEPAQDGTVAETPTGEDIVVTGLRRSLETSQNIKRNADQIVDAIVAEDIGKLPDITASASLARVTGVQVNRAAGEAAQVQIRGLPDITTTYNGREIFTAEGRFVQIQDFPAGGVAALEVYKSSTANLLEGGIGGQVNVRSRRPFDFSGFELQGAINGIHTESAGKFDWNGNLLASGRWDTGIGEMGLLVNLAYTDLRFLDSTREQAVVAGVAQASQTSQPGFRFPDAVALFYGRGDRQRPSVNAAFQWNPAPDFEIVVDGLFQGYRAEDTNTFLFVPLFGPANFTNVVLQDDGRRAQSLTASYPDPLSFRPDGFRTAAEAKTDTYQIAGGAVYDPGQLRLSVDAAYTDSTFELQAYNIDYAFATSPVRDINFDVDGSYGGPTFNFRDFDVTNPANFLYRGLFQENLVATGDDIQVRGDVEYETELNFLTRIQAGVRYNDRGAARQRGVRYDPGLQLGRTLSSLPLDVRPIYPGFRNDEAQPFRTFLLPTGSSILRNIDAIRTIAGAPEGPPPFDPIETFDANEKSYAAYGQVRYELPLGGMTLDGLVGLRAIKTETNVIGTARNVRRNPVPNQPDIVTLDAVDRTNEYTDYLPNASARLVIQEGLQLRLAYTETRTRPNFIDLNPSGGVSPEPDICRTDPTSVNCVRDFFGGNPNLDPLTSTNYDVSLEYYFSRAGSLTGALFRRDVSGFISRAIVETNDPQFGRLRSNIPFNGGDGRIQGAEVAFSSFLDIATLPEWARSFGLQANYTYIESESELPGVLGEFLPDEFGDRPALAGVSKHSYNIIGLFERPKFSARLAYNYRSKYVLFYSREFDPGLQPAAGIGPTLPFTQRGRGNLDFSMTITPVPQVTIAFDALNILANPVQVDREYELGNSFPRQVRYLERLYSLGVRFRF